MQLTIHNAILDSTLNTVDIGIDSGRISSISATGLPPGEQSIDADGAMVSPPFIDSHFHLENAFLYDSPNNSGTLREAIEIYAGIKKALTPEDIVTRSKRVARKALAHGTQWLRCHVDIDHIARLRLLEGVVAARDALQDVFNIDIVAFPQWGLAENPEAVDFMWQAMENGAQIVGGMPHGERDMDAAARHIEVAFEIAKKYDADIDMHVDETDNPYWHSLELLAEKTIEEGYQGRVSAGHCCAMGSWDDRLAERVIAKVKDADVNIIANVPVNLYLEGRSDSHPFRRGIPRIRDLYDAGVNVCLGQDDVLNMFYPFGQLDMLEVANFVTHTAHMSTPGQIAATFDMPRYNAARTLRLKEYGLEEGAPANLILIDAGTAVDAIRTQPERLYVIKDGEILVQSKRSLQFSPAVPS